MAQRPSKPEKKVKTQCSPHTLPLRGLGNQHEPMVVQEKEEREDCQMSLHDQLLGSLGEEKYFEQDSHLENKNLESSPFFRLENIGRINQLDITPIFDRMPLNLNQLGLEKEIILENQAKREQVKVAKKLDFHKSANMRDYQNINYQQTLFPPIQLNPPFERSFVAENPEPGEEEDLGTELSEQKRPRSKRNGSQSLKMLSTSVVEVIKSIKKGTYKDIANQLVIMLFKSATSVCKKEAKEISNVKRRIYDALNVLISSNILRKEHKFVFLNKTKTEEEEQQQLADKATRQQLIQQVKIKRKNYYNKIEKLLQLYLKYAAVSNLKIRNESQPKPAQVIYLPFVCANFSDKTKLKVEQTENSIRVAFDKPINMWGDVETITKLGLHTYECERKDPEWMVEMVAYIKEVIEKFNGGQ